MVPPNGKALLIVDMLRDFLEEGSPMEVPAGRWIIENIVGEIRYHREKNRPIFYLCSRNDSNDADLDPNKPFAMRGTPGAEVIDPLAPQPGDYVIEKPGFSGFYNTNLDNLLEQLDIDEVLICGVLTNVGVLYTAMDAMQRGLAVIVPETCVAGLTEADHKFALHQITRILRPLLRD